MAPSHKITHALDGEGKATLKVEIFGPIPDPLAGLSYFQRQDVLAYPLNRAEREALRAVKKLPRQAQLAVAHDILAARRQVYDAWFAQQVRMAETARRYQTDLKPDYEPEM